MAGMRWVQRLFRRRDTVIQDNHEPPSLPHFEVFLDFKSVLRNTQVNELAESYRNTATCRLETLVFINAFLMELQKVSKNYEDYFDLQCFENSWLDYFKNLNSLLHKTEDINEPIIYHAVPEDLINCAMTLKYILQLKYVLKTVSYKALKRSGRVEATIFDSKVSICLIQSCGLLDKMLARLIGTFVSEDFTRKYTSLPDKSRIELMDSLNEFKEQFDPDLADKRWYIMDKLMGITDYIPETNPRQEVQFDDVPFNEFPI